MKKAIIFLRSMFCATIASFLFICCSDEVSTMKPEDVKGRATIQGKLLFNQGYERSYNGIDPYKEKEDEPAKDKLVIIEIPNSSYKTGSTGVQRFTTRSNGEGVFSIIIPVSPNGCNATIKTEDFVATYCSMPDYDWEKDEYIFEPKDRSFKTAPDVISIEQNDIFIRTIKYYPDLNN